MGNTVVFPKTWLKTAVLTILLGMVFLLSGLRADAANSTRYVTASALNVRTGPGTSYEKYGKLPNGSEVTVLEDADGWSKILYDNGEYYVCSTYLSDTAPAPAPEGSNVSDLDMCGLVFDGNVSQACKDKALSLYAVLPSNVKNRIVESGFQVVVSDNSWWTEGHAGSYYPMAGSFPQGRVIAIYAGSVSKVNISVLHECGHFVDEYIGTRDGYGLSPSFGYPALTTSAEWMSIYAAEAGASGFSSYATDCQEDYFAEAFWKCLVSPSWAQSTIPQSYAFIMSHVNAM